MKVLAASVSIITDGIFSSITAGQGSSFFNLDGLPASEELNEIRSFLRSEAAFARAPTTFNAYRGPWLKFCAFCDRIGVPFLPAEPRVAALFLGAELARCKAEGLGAGTVLQASAAISCYHWLVGLQSPSSASPQCKLVREIARRRCAPPGTNRKKGVTVEQVDLVVRHLVQKGKLDDLILAVAIILGFYGFLRADEIVQVRWGTIQWPTDCFQVFVPSSKTDQYMEGAWITIAFAPQTSKVMCPAQVVRNLILKGGYAGVNGPKPFDCPAYLVRGVFYCKSTKSLILRSSRKAFGYTTLLKKTKSIFHEICQVDESSLGVHSLRIGPQKRGER